MTPDEHARYIADTAHAMIIVKYEAGQREHGGKLWKMRNLIDEAIREAIDQVTYLITLRDQLEQDGIVLGDLEEN